MPAYVTVTIPANAGPVLREAARRLREKSTATENFDGEDAPELDPNTVVLGPDQKEIADNYLALKAKAKDAKETAKSFDDDAEIALESLLEAAGPDARRILFDDCDLALNVDRKTTLKAVKDMRSIREKKAVK